MSTVPGVAPAATTTTAPKPVVDVHGLVKSFDGRVVLDNVDVRVWPGKILSIIGQSGGGKTTLMRCIKMRCRSPVASPTGSCSSTAGSSSSRDRPPTYSIVRPRHEPGLS